MTTTSLKIAVAQLNPIVGDLSGNYSMLWEAYEEAAKAGADLVVAPECVLTGYPLEDLVLRNSFITEATKLAHDLMFSVLSSGYKTGLIFGAPYIGYAVDELRFGPQPSYKPEGIYNGAFIADPLSTMRQQGSSQSPERVMLATFVSKAELPNYGVFDEKRVFSSAPALEARCVEFRGAKIGLMICEDAWFPTVSHALYKDDADFLIAINGSPFEAGKNVTRRQIVAKRVKETGLPFLYVNLVGGQDELVFDGGSFLWDGKQMQEAPHFVEGLTYFDTQITNDRSRSGVCSMSWGDPAPEPIATLEGYPRVEPAGVADIYRAAVLGTRDYLRKNNTQSVALGYSGGVDSGLVAAIACDAIGAHNVNLVRLPSKFSSQGSLDDAEEGATRLGAPLRTIIIEPVVEALRIVYRTSIYDGRQLTGVADENIQARARGTILMSISNQEGHMILTTGNKSEVSVGYSTLYGDMNGGFNPIKDAYKTMVWALCRYRNGLSEEEITGFRYLGRAAEVVPEEIISKPPSAELRPDQKDEDSLPPYPVLDAILEGMIERERSVQELVLEGFDEELVKRVRWMIDRNEYKRRQAAPGIKFTNKLHGRERRYPITNHWR